MREGEKGAGCLNPSRPLLRGAPTFTLCLTCRPLPPNAPPSSENWTPASSSLQGWPPPPPLPWTHPVPCWPLSLTTHTHTHWTPRWDRVSLRPRGAPAHTLCALILLQTHASFHFLCFDGWGNARTNTQTQPLDEAFFLESFRTWRRSGRGRLPLLSSSDSLSLRARALPDCLLVFPGGSPLPFPGQEEGGGSAASITYFPPWRPRASSRRSCPLARQETLWA